MLTMVLGGLWHGPAWNFVAWGGYHGALLAVHRWWRARRAVEDPEPRAGGMVARLVMFHLACLGWIVFRADSVGTIQAYFAGLVRPGIVWSPAFGRALVWTGIAFVIHQLCAERDFGRRFVALPPIAQAASYATVVILVFLFSPVTQRFIYFQF